MASISPQTVDLLIITILEGIKILSKLAKNEDIKDEDLRLETFEETLARIKKELGKEEIS